MTESPWLDSMLIDQLPLSIRTKNTLKNAGFLTVADVKNVEDAQLLRQPNFGRRSLHELREILRGEQSAAFADLKREIQTLRAEADLWRARFEGAIELAKAMTPKVDQT